MTDLLDVLRHQVLSVCVRKLKAVVPLLAFSGDDLESLRNTARPWIKRSYSIGGRYNLV